MSLQCELHAALISCPREGGGWSRSAVGWILPWERPKEHVHRRGRAFSPPACVQDACTCHSLTHQLMCQLKN